MDDECPVCLDVLGQTDAISVHMTCGHVLCETCALDWLIRCANCPVCREPCYRLRLTSPSDAKTVALNPHGPLGLTLCTPERGELAIVIRVEERSTADYEGILVGDRLVKINEEPIRHSDHAVQLFREARQNYRFCIARFSPSTVVWGRRLCAWREIRGTGMFLVNVDGEDICIGAYKGMAGPSLLKFAQNTYCNRAGSMLLRCTTTRTGEQAREQEGVPLLRIL